MHALLPKLQAKVDALTLATRNWAATDLEAKARQLLLGLQVVFKEYCPTAFSIGVLVQDCDWVGRDPSCRKNALAVLKACLRVMLAIVGAEWENL